MVCMAAVSKLPVLLLIGRIILCLHTVDAGCVEDRLCCYGHNSSCKSRDRHYGQRASIPPLTLRGFKNEQRQRVISGDGEVLGHLILPDIVELDAGEKNDWGDGDFPATVDRVDTNKRAKKTSLREILFGQPFYDPPHPYEEIDQNGKPIIGLQYLNRYLPVKITDVQEESDYNDDEYPSYERFVYLNEGEQHCMCDEACTSMGDCCSDYSYFCSRRDCEVSQWSEWSSCQVYQKHAICGHGKSERFRTITQQPVNGGRPCSHLSEAKACYQFCRATAQDNVTVALLLPYKFRHARQNYKHRPALIPDRNHTQYCTKYVLGWSKPICDPKYWYRLMKGQEICVECQKEAQYHRPTARCASDVKVGENGYWKLLHTPSCFGLWKKVSHVDDCSCANDKELKSLPAYLFV